MICHKTMAALVVGGCLSAMIVPVQPAQANETVVYTYDALGRLVKSVRSGAVNNGVETDIQYDAAGNRVQYEVSGASATAGNFPTETPPEFSLTSGQSKQEGQALTFTVSRSASTDVTYSVSWETRHGTANAQDYSASEGTLTFSPQDGSKTITVQTTEDGNYEPNETFFVDLTGASGGATLGTATRQGTIVNDDVQNTPPVANGDSITVNYCSFTQKDVLDNDTDDDQPLTLQSVEQGLLGQVTFTPAGVVSFSSYGVGGVEALEYVVQDSLGAQSTGTISITVNGSGACN